MKVSQRVDDGALVEVLVGLSPDGREGLRGEALGLAQRCEGDPERGGLASVWAAVAELAAEVSAAGGAIPGPDGAAWLHVVGAAGTVSAAVGRCPSGLRRVLAVTAARQRDHDVVDRSPASAAWWAALAALVAEVDDAERAELRRLDDDAAGVTGAACGPPEPG